MATVENLRRTGQFAFAEPDYRARATDVITPNDPGWPSQWGPAKIQAPAAWSLVTDTRVIIAVVDSGVQLSHEDLASEVWTNPGEIPGNGLDDGNGKVDDIHGWNFYQMWTGTVFTPSENANVQDDYGRGTHVAGIAAAETNNSVGIAGVAWGARVVPVKVLDEYGTGWYSDIALGLAYAANNRAKIINLSLGARNPLKLCAQRWTMRANAECWWRLRRVTTRTLAVISGCVRVGACGGGHRPGRSARVVFQPWRAGGLGRAGGRHL